MYSLQPGEWYILFECDQCKARQILFPDLSKGKAVLRATYTARCRKCEHVGQYDGETLERYQHPPNADPITLAIIGFGLLLGVSNLVRLKIASQKNR
jgi:hypothetical protein